jgi:hypothetical protein
VRQDEYLTWQRQDLHAQAYATLRSGRSRAIASNLGLADATGAHECLACHADNAPPEARGERFQVSDGVGCEMCHGAAERWLAPHTRGYASHAQRTAAGMYPTWEPSARAQMCLGCHQGDAQHPMTHAIMGAGHPPLLFELDTFCALQPGHWQADADYLARKGKPDDARNWAVGQARAAQGELAGLETAVNAPGPAGSLFPELAWFDCNGCHRPLQPLHWQPDDTGLGAGRVRIADASLYLTGLWLEEAEPDIAARWREAVRALHAASQKGAPDLREAIKAARALLDSEVLPRAQKHEHTRAQLRALALRIADAGAAARSTDFAVAEQSAMATAVLVTALQGQGTAPKGVRDALDAVYAAVGNRNAYDAEAMRKALKAVRAEIAKAFPAG